MDPGLHNFCTTWIELSFGNLLNNVKQFRKIIGQKVFLSHVVKANAYGHGLREIAKISNHIDDVNSFCTNNISEALELRLLKISKSILVLNPYDKYFVSQAIENNITLTVCELGYAKSINAIAKRQNKIAKIHIKIDTGLSRLGASLDYAFSLIKQAIKLKNIKIEGVYTHLAGISYYEKIFMIDQLNKFDIFL